MNSLIKAPEDQFNIFAYFDGDMSAIEVVTSAVISSTNVETGLDSTVEVIANSSQGDRSVEVMLLAGQSAGENHKITVVATTSIGMVYEKDILLDVEDVTIGEFKKRPDEEFQILFDFTPHLESIEALDTISVAAVSDGVDVTSSVIEASAIDGQGVAVTVKAGAENSFIDISVQADCTDLVLGQTKRIKRSASMSVLEGDCGGVLFEAGSGVLIGICSEEALSVLGGCAPYTWSIAGPGYSVDSTTYEPSNTLQADGTITGDSSVTVTDCSGLEVSIPVTASSTVLLWDAASDDNIAPNSTAALVLSGGAGGPYNWSVAGAGYSLADSTTTEQTNTLLSDGTIVGDAVITVSEGNCADSIIETITATCLEATTFDYDLSDETVARDGTAVVYVDDPGNDGPYTWSVTGVGFSFATPVTATKYNTLSADNTACGSAEITITPVNCSAAVGSVRCTTGQWVRIATDEIAARGVITGTPTGTGGNPTSWYKIEGKYRLNEDIEIGSFGSDCRLPPNDWQKLPADIAPTTLCEQINGSVFGAITGCCTGFGNSIYRAYINISRLDEWQC